MFFSARKERKSFFAWQLVLNFYICCILYYIITFVIINAGQRFSILKLKAIIASLIHNFYLEPVDYFEDTEVMIKIILCPIQAIHVKFVPIDLTNSRNN